MTNALNDAAELAVLLKTGADYHLLTTEQVATLLGRSVAQLANDRRVGLGPAWVQPFGPNGVVRYRLGDVRAFTNAPAA
ncbi:helix-turn-helix transcriptional regulator [Paraburkholderia fungorum]|uniref:helix-turn-helix transcriptional regulator n=1 Tax=Paraburkholderia TaxID=1822464 RepID=UPI003878176D